MPKVSVVIPVYNVEAYLRQCLDSVVNQTLRELEIICVDDGSTDGSSAILAEYAARDARVKVLAHAHTNAGEARNAGMAAATGEYLGFVDADDFVGAEMLARMTTADGADTADVVVAGHRTLENGKITTDRLAKRFLDAHNAQDGVYPPWLFLDAGVAPWNKLFRRAFVQGLGLCFQSAARHNDVRFVCSALAAANQLAVSNTCGYVYRRGRRGGITQAEPKRGGFLFAEVLLSLRQEIVRLGQFEKAAQAYANLALAHCCYHLLGEFEPMVFMALYSELHAHLLADLGLQAAGEAVFVNKKHYNYLQAILADATPLSLWMLLLKERYASWKELCSRGERIAALQKSVTDAQNRIAALTAKNGAMEAKLREQQRTPENLKVQTGALTAEAPEAKEESTPC